MPKYKNPVRIIAKCYGISQESVISGSRKSNKMEARKILIWYLHNYKKMSYDFMKYFIKVTPNNISLHEKYVADRMKVDKPFRRRVEDIVKLLE